MPFDFRNIFASIGHGIVVELKRRMQDQRGTDERGYSPLKPATIRAKQRISNTTANLRMIRTKDFQNNAFQSEPLSNGLRVSISTGQHGRELKSLTRTLGKYVAKGQTRKASAQRTKIAQVKSPTYRDIAEWQLDTDAAIFFPQSDEQIMNLESVKRGMILFETEAVKQADAQFRLQITRELRIA